MDRGLHGHSNKRLFESILFAMQKRPYTGAGREVTLYLPRVNISQSNTPNDHLKIVKQYFKIKF